MISTSHSTDTGLSLAQCIDHTKLTFSADENQKTTIDTLCQEAVEHGFYAVCVRPEHIKQAKTTIGTGNVKVATVIGFPKDKRDLKQETMTPTIGSASTESKLKEVQNALAQQVDELDLVLNVGLFKREVAQNIFLDHESSETLKELNAIKKASQGRPIKVIIETDLLSDEEIVKATLACSKVGVFMVKTSTGMLIGGKGATPEAISLIRETLNNNQGMTIQIKASGGVKTREQALHLLQLGANRLGTSSGLLIASEAFSELS